MLLGRLAALKFASTPDMKQQWRELFAAIDELAAAEKINSSYLSRLARRTLLAAAIVEATLNGRHGMTLPGLPEPFPVEWAGQLRGKSPGPVRPGSKWWHL